MAMLFLSGQMVPLSLLPAPVQALAAVLPFRWMVSFPVELLLGRVSPQDTLAGYGGAAGLAGGARGPGGARLAGRPEALRRRGGLSVLAYLRLFRVFLKVGVLNELEYRVNFYVQILRSLIGLATGLAGLSVVYSHTDTLGGWSPPELLALLGVFFIVSGAINLVIAPSMQRFMEDVRQGTLDFTLTKPEDSQVLVSVKQVQIWKLVDVAHGAGGAGDRPGASCRPRSGWGRPSPSGSPSSPGGSSSTASTSSSPPPRSGSCGWRMCW